MLEAAVQAVRHFNEKHGFPLDRPLVSINPHATTFLLSASKMLLTLSETARMEPRDPRADRAHHLLQELGELLAGMARCDEEETLDGMVDLTYILIGCGTTFNLPFANGFKEVH